MYAIGRLQLIFVILDFVRRTGDGGKRYGKEADYRVAPDSG